MLSDKQLRKLCAKYADAPGIQIGIIEAHAERVRAKGGRASIFDTFNELMREIFGK